MEQVDGKSKILKVSMDLIMKNGYSAVSIRNIVKKANISIGTLYYHFPLGKVSILNELINSLRDKLGFINDFSEVMHETEFPEIKKDFLYVLVNSIRKLAPIIKGFEVELLTNNEILKDMKALMAARQDEISKNMSSCVKFFVPEYKGKERSLSIFKQMLINTIYFHVITDNFYGTDDEFIEVLINVINGFLLTSKK